MKVLDNGTFGLPVPRFPSFDSEMLVVQYVSRVIGSSSEWTNSTSFLQSIGLVPADVYSGNVSQSVFGSCYCNLGLIGPPDCEPVSSDCMGTWSPLSMMGGQQWIDLEFDQRVMLSQVRVLFCFLCFLCFWVVNVSSSSLSSAQSIAHAEVCMYVCNWTACGNLNPLPICIECVSISPRVVSSVANVLPDIRLSLQHRLFFNFLAHRLSCTSRPVGK